MRTPNRQRLDTIEYVEYRNCDIHNGSNLKPVIFSFTKSSYSLGPCNSPVGAGIDEHSSSLAISHSMACQLELFEANPRKNSYTI